MGVFDDVGRICDASKNNPRPGLVDGIEQAADAAEAAQAMKAMAATGGVPQGVNGQSFNPFENMQGMAAATRGTGTIAKLVDTEGEVPGRRRSTTSPSTSSPTRHRRSRSCTGR